MLLVVVTYRRQAVASTTRTTVAMRRGHHLRMRMRGRRSGASCVLLFFSFLLWDESALGEIWGPKYVWTLEKSESPNLRFFCENSGSVFRVLLV